MMTIQQAIGYGLLVCRQHYWQLLKENREDVRQELALCALTGTHVRTQLSRMARQYGYHELKAGFRGRAEKAFCREVLFSESPGPGVFREDRGFSYRAFAVQKKSCECGKCAKCRDRIRQLKRRNG